MSLRDNLETLEHETTTIRVLARSLADSTRLAGDDNPMNDPEARRGWRPYFANFRPRSRHMVASRPSVIYPTTNCWSLN